jgi:hypothetical protein
MNKWPTRYITDARDEDIDGDLVSLGECLRPKRGCITRYRNLEESKRIHQEYRIADKPKLRG